MLQNKKLALTSFNCLKSSYVSQRDKIDTLVWAVYQQEKSLSNPGKKERKKYDKKTD